MVDLHPRPTFSFATEAVQRVPAPAWRTVLGVLSILTAVLLSGCGTTHPRPPGAVAPVPGTRPRAATRPSATARARAERAAVARLGKLAMPIYCGGHHGNEVALTFDDGPGPYTPLALKALRRAGVRATFFLVAKSIATFPTWPRRERALAALGDHTATHPFLPGLSPAAAAAEIDRGRAAVLAAAGSPVQLFRPPYGARTPALDQRVAADGMTQILWSVDSGDSYTQVPQNYAAIARTVDHGTFAGSIVLMHENRGQTIRALRTILPALRRRHLRPVTLPKLLADDPPSRAQLRAGPRGCRLAGPSSSGG
jgi:peptidoglycan/xylan/chitin deacetylase (PgdA/CDA1 family)